MSMFECLSRYNYEQLILCNDNNSGLKAIIAIHDTTLGPALGGTRMWTYASETEALVDALRLSRGMTYKNAAAGLNFGGGKTVIIGDPRKDKSEEMFRAFGRYVQGLNGRYITAEDVGIDTDDMDYIHMETKYLCGFTGSGGDTSSSTAYGVYIGMKAAAKEAFGSDSLKGKTIAVQGVGHVGLSLCRHLAKEGAKLIVCDINEEAVNRAVVEFDATKVTNKNIYGVDCDIYAPCALGAVINDKTISQLKCKVIAGSANNVLADDRHGDELESKGIIYAPDFVINAGGVIKCAVELTGYDEEICRKKVAKIYRNIQRVFEIAKRDRIATYKAAERMAEERMAQIGVVKSTYVAN
jgi:leucine dehydrogenase